MSATSLEKLGQDSGLTTKLTEQQENHRTTDDTLTMLQTIGALVNVLPGELPTDLSLRMIFTLFAEKNPTTFLKAPQKLYKVVRQYLVDDVKRIP